MNKIIRYTGILALFLFCSVKIVAQDSTQYILAGGMVNIDNERIDDNVLVTITDKHISNIQINPNLSDIEITVDLTEYTILPGLIDCHSHLTGNWYLSEEEFDPYRLPPASYGILGTINAKKTIEAGFTTVRDVHSYFYGDIAIRDAINMGWIPGPRMYVTGPGITITGGHGAWGNWLAPHLEFKNNLISIADGEEEVRKETRKHLKYSVDWIKIFATGGFGSYGTIPGAASYNVEELKIAVDEARKQGRFVAAHAHGTEGINNALKAGVRSIEHGTYLDDESIALFKEKDAYLVMDLKAAHYDIIESKTDSGKSMTDQASIEEYREISDRFKKAYDSGVNIAFGTDAGVFPHGRNAEQFSLMKDAGMREIDIIRSATITAAELLGKEDEIGSLEVGKLADIIAVKGNPLSDIEILVDIVFVMKEGKIYKKRQ